MTTKLNISPPPRIIKRGLLATSATLVQSESVNVPTQNNMAIPNNGLQDLNFKVSPEMHKRFKMEATARGMSMKDLLEACFTVYLERFSHK